jgi:hypothetical protein
MRESMIIIVVLTITFVTAFIGTTILSDLVCQQNGYYQSGRDAEKVLYE